MSNIETMEIVGLAHLSVRTMDEAGRVSRRSLLPGSFVGGQWVNTSLSDESAEVQVFAASNWTPETVASYRSSVTPAPVDSDALDTRELNAALAAEGSVFRALALLFLQEINAVRAKLAPPLPAYTLTQFKTALKAKMR